MSLISNIKSKLGKTSSILSLNILETFKNKRVDSSTLEELETILISSDISLDVVNQLIEDERTRRAELDTAIDSTNQKIAVVISKFEGRCSEKDRLLRAVARHRQ